jgi:hypothetical protein
VHFVSNVDAVGCGITFGLPFGFASLYVSTQNGSVSKSENESGTPTW